MPADLDTVLVAVYTLIDTLDQTHIAPVKPRRRGRPPVLSDSEVLTLLLLGQWLGNSERALLCHAATYWSGYFPRLLSQSAFNRRARELGPVCARLMHLVAEALGAAQSPYQIVDTTPVPLARLCRGKHHRLFADDAAIGRGGSDKHVSYGCALLLAVAADGPVTGFVVGPASTEGRWLLDALLGWRADPSRPLWTATDPPPPRPRGRYRERQDQGSRRQGYVGPTGQRWWPGSAGTISAGPYIADGGFTGAAWHGHWWRDTGASVLTPARSTPDAPREIIRQHQGWRQRIETVNAILADALHLAYPQAKTAWGVMMRIAAKCAAFNVGIWVNRLLQRPDLAVATLPP